MKKEGVDMDDYPGEISEWVERGLETYTDAVAFVGWAVYSKGLQMKPFATECVRYSLKQIGDTAANDVNTLWCLSRDLLREENISIEQVSIISHAAMAGRFEPEMLVEVLDDEVFNDERLHMARILLWLKEAVQVTLEQWMKQGHPALMFTPPHSVSVNMGLMGEMEPDFAGLVVWLDSQIGTDLIQEKQVLDPDTGEVVTGREAEQTQAEVVNDILWRDKARSEEYASDVAIAEHDGDVDGDWNDDDPFKEDE